MRSNITIDGRGANIVIRGAASGSTINARRGDSNFILMYITFDGPVGNNNDLLQFDNTESVSPNSSNLMERWWLYHVSVKNSEDETISFRRSYGKWTVQSCYVENVTGTGYVWLLNNMSLGGGESVWDQIQMEGTIESESLMGLQIKRSLNHDPVKLVALFWRSSTPAMHAV